MEEPEIPVLHELAQPLQSGDDLRIVQALSGAVSRVVCDDQHATLKVRRSSGPIYLAT